MESLHLPFVLKGRTVTPLFLAPSGVQYPIVDESIITVTYVGRVNPGPPEFGLSALHALHPSGAQLFMSFMPMFPLALAVTVNHTVTVGTPLFSIRPPTLTTPLIRSHPTVITIPQGLDNYGSSKLEFANAFLENLEKLSVNSAVHTH